MTTQNKHFDGMIIDYDGTLAGDSSKITQKVKDAIIQAKDKVKISLCTGRPYNFVLDVARDLGLDTCHVTEGGGRVVDSDGNVLWERLIPEKEIIEMSDLAREWGLSIATMAGGDQFRREPTHDEINYVSGILFSDHDRGRVESFMKLLAEKFPDSIHPILSSHRPLNKPRDWLVFVTARGANKQHALLHLAKIEGLELKNFIAVGDGYNDFPLLMACGFRVAMGNAAPELKKIADYTAPSVEDDGLADVIERFILNTSPRPSF